MKIRKLFSVTGFFSFLFPFDNLVAPSDLSRDPFRGWKPLLSYLHFGDIPKSWIEQNILYVHKYISFCL